MSGGYMAFGGEATRAASFDSVFADYHNYVYSLAHTLLGNAQDAEDVSQEVFVRVYKALPSYDPERASMRTWLTKLTVNVCNTQRRRNLLQYLWRKGSPDGDGDDLVERVDLSLLGAPEEYALQTELRRAVRDLLAKLRPEHRTVLVLHYFLELSCQEIASILDCPEGTIYSRLHYARRVVQSRLERQDGHLRNEVGL